MSSGGRIINRLTIFTAPGMNDTRKKEQEVKIEKAAKLSAKKLGMV